MDIHIRSGLAEARALAGAHRGPLAVYVVMGVVLPFLLLSSEPIFSLRTVMAIAADPWTYRVTGSIAGPLYMLGIVVVIVSGALLAAWTAILAELREGYLGEIMAGLVGGVGFLLVSLLVNLVIGFILAAIIFTTVGIDAWNAQPLWVQYPLRLFGWIATSWLQARFCLAGPIMGAEGKIEPVSAFVRSWRQTRPAQGRLFALVFAFNLGSGVVVGLLIMLHGYLIVSGEPGSLAEMLMSGAWLIFWGLYFAIIVLVPAGLLRAAQPRDVADVFA